MTMPKNLAEPFAEQWPEATTGCGAHSSGITKEKDKWTLWVCFETDEELTAFNNWFHKSLGVVPTKWEEVSSTTVDGEKITEFVLSKLERLQ